MPALQVIPTGREGSLSGSWSDLGSASFVLFLKLSHCSFLPWGGKRKPGHQLVGRHNPTPGLALRKGLGSGTSPSFTRLHSEGPRQSLVVALPGGPCCGADTVIGGDWEERSGGPAFLVSRRANGGRRLPVSGMNPFGAARGGAAGRSAGSLRLAALSPFQPLRAPAGGAAGAGRCRQGWCWMLRSSSDAGRPRGHPHAQRGSAAPSSQNRAAALKNQLLETPFLVPPCVGRIRANHHHPGCSSESRRLQLLLVGARICGAKPFSGRMCNHF